MKYKAAMKERLEEKTGQPSCQHGAIIGGRKLGRISLSMMPEISYVSCTYSLKIGQPLWSTEVLKEVKR